MKLQTLTTKHQRLRWLISEVKKFDAEQPELRAHWARYLCVLSSGFLESAIREIYGRYARSCSNTTVADFVEGQLRLIHNPKAGRFLETATAFNKDWREGLAATLDADGNGAAIDAIMSNRHLIAHGKDSDITLARLSDYLSKSVRVIEFIETQCDIH